MPSTCNGCKWRHIGQHCHDNGGCMQFTETDEFAWLDKFADRNNPPFMFGLESLKVRVAFVGIQE